MIDVVMLVRNRPELTHQAISSLHKNALGKYTLTVVDDASDKENSDKLLELWNILYPYREGGNCWVITNPNSLGTGASRNLGVKLSDAIFRRSNHLYFSDNDAYFTEGWDVTLLEAFTYAKALGFKLLGGYCHPFNQTKYQIKVEKLNYVLCAKDALGHLSCLMEWDTWDKYGPLEVTPVGRVNASEDFAFSQNIRKDGWKVGSIWPWVVYNCGRTDSFGNKSPGDDSLYQVPEGVIVR